MDSTEINLLGPRVLMIWLVHIFRWSNIALRMDRHDEHAVRGHAFVDAFY